MGLRVRVLRVARKLTQEQLAERAGLDRTYVSRIERGEHNLTLLTLNRLADGLDVPVKELQPMTVTRHRPKGSAEDQTYSDTELAWLKAVGLAIRLGRARLGWSQTELAERSGSSRPTVSSTERGFQASLVTYRRLAAALGLSLSEVLEQAQDAPRKSSPAADEATKGAV